VLSGAGQINLAQFPSAQIIQNKPIVRLEKDQIKLAKDIP
jgi:hypothetical protein